MLVLVGEGDELRLYARTVAWTGGLYLSVEQRRVVKVGFQYVVYALVGVASPAGQLFQNAVRGHVAELMKVSLAVLPLGIFEVYRALVKSYGCARLHSCGANAPSRDGLGEVCNGRLGAASAWNLMSSDVHQTVEKGAGRDDDTLCAYLYAPYRAHADGFPVLYEQLVGLILPDVEIGGAVKSRPPPPDKLSSVALRAR